MRDILPKSSYKPYPAVLERIGLSRRIHWLEECHAWHATKGEGSVNNFA